MNTKLAVIYNQIPKSTCPPGCGKCCGILFPSLAELRNIMEWCKAHSRQYKDFHMTLGLGCPYLGGNNECTIYPVRPFLCRIMGVSNLTCPLNLCKSEKVLNPSQSAALYKAIYQQGKEKPRAEKHRKLLRGIL